MLSSRQVLRNSILGGAVLAAVLTAIPARAAPASFDGFWSVLVITDQGACDRTYRYGVQISNGQVFSESSGADIFGRVTPRGQINVRVRQGNQEAVGSGRLTQVSGSGRWIAERRGRY